MNSPSDIVVNQLFNNAIKKLTEGESADAIFDYFITYGVTPSHAKKLVAEACMIVEAMPKANPRADGLKSVFTGMGWLVFSLIIFALVRSMSAVVILPSGIALLGTAMILNGLWKMIFAKDLVQLI